MKITRFILLLVFVYGCNPKSNKKELQTNNRITKAPISSKNTFKATSLDTLTADDKDSVLIYAAERHNWKASKNELRNYVKDYPELTEQLPPDVAYARKAYNHVSFSSEVGQDDYYILYAYFLKKANGEVKYQNQRENLITLYHKINFMMGRMNNGGTYYGHMYRRILGYAEYSVSLYKDGYSQRNYDISKQKSLYINSLKQYIIDEMNADTEITTKEKPKLKNELFKTIDEINNLITEYFYLVRAQEFLYSNY